jgi:hypothetical protein
LAKPVPAPFVTPFFQIRQPLALMPCAKGQSEYSVLPVEVLAPLKILLNAVFCTLLRQDPLGAVPVAQVAT